MRDPGSKFTLWKFMDVKDHDSCREGPFFRQGQPAGIAPTGRLFRRHPNQESHDLRATGIRQDYFEGVPFTNPSSEAASAEDGLQWA
jgi:hypothetical protein